MLVFGILQHFCYVLIPLFLTQRGFLVWFGFCFYFPKLMLGTVKTHAAHVLRLPAAFSYLSAQPEHRKTAGLSLQAWMIIS